MTRLPLFAILSIAIVATTGVLVTSFFTYRFAHDQLDHALDQRILDAAEEAHRALAAPGVASDQEAAQRILDSIRRASNLENLFLFDQQRRCLLDARPNVKPGKLYTYLEIPPEMVQRVSQGHSAISRRRDLADIPFRSCAIPFKVGNIQQGGIYAQANISFEQGLNQLRRGWITTSALAATATFALTALLLLVLARARASRLALQRQARFSLVHRLSAGIAHDMKSPLTRMQRSLERLPTDDDTASLRKAYDQLAEQVEQLVGSSADLEPADLPVATLVHNLAQTLRGDLESRGISLRIDIEPDVEVVAPALLVRLALANVLQNAIEAVPEKTGSIHLAIRRQQRLVGIAVSDNGPGMDASTKRRLFDPLMSTKERGSGLGLPVTRQFLQDMGGHLSVESRPGSGTTVILWIPQKAHGKHPRS